jgi:hypothetical protein
VVSNCANPACARPLHYLRDGRVFLFHAAECAPGSAASASPRLEHYWLCGECAQRLRLVKDALGIHVIARAGVAHETSETPPRRTLP